MPKFRKKPVVIEAFQVTGPTEDTQAIHQWFMDAVIQGTIEGFTDGHLEIKTLEGVMRADVGDWIIKGVKDEIYPCKPDIFAATYEPV